MIREEMKPEDWDVRVPLTLSERDTTRPLAQDRRKLAQQGRAKSCLLPS
jgi:hypothetical protein